jgi:hypothetical protein
MSAQPEELVVEYVGVDELELATYNPRSIRPGPLAKLKRSLEAFGFSEPLVANKFNNRLIGGHQRIRAAKELGHTKVPVVWRYIEDEEQEKALNIALNNAELSGEWDSKKLAEVLSSIEDKSVQLLSGFDTSQVAGFIDRAKEKEQPVYPLAARMLEHYDYVVIFVTNDTDWMSLQTMMELETEQSYKKQKIGIGRIVPFSKFRDIWLRNRPMPTVEPKPLEVTPDDDADPGEGPEGSAADTAGS